MPLRGDLADLGPGRTAHGGGGRKGGTVTRSVLQAERTEEVEALRNSVVGVSERGE